MRCTTTTIRDLVSRRQMARFLMPLTLAAGSIFLPGCPLGTETLDLECPDSTDVGTPVLATARHTMNAAPADGACDGLGFGWSVNGESIRTSPGVEADDVTCSNTFGVTPDAPGELIISVEAQLTDDEGTVSVLSTQECSVTVNGDAPEDAGQPPEDAGQPPEDAGQPPEDAGQPIEDAGQPPEDAGQPVEDAGQPPEDAGQPVEDAGQPPEDAGQPVEDAGQPPEDAGQPVEDAGQPPEDAGQPAPDAGATDAGPTDAGATDAGPTDAGPTDAGPSDGGMP